MAARNPIERKTGAKKGLAPVAAWALALGCIVGWGSFVMPAGVFLPMAGPGGTAIAFGAGALAMTVIAANYGYMAKRFPDDGGVYSYTRATFGTNQAFICSWCLVLAYCTSMISNSTALALIVRSIAGGVLQFGFHYSVAGYDVYLGEMLAALAVTAGAAAVCIRGARLAGIVQTVLVVGLVAGAAGMALIAFADPQVTLESLKPAYSPHTSPVAGVLAVMTVVPFAFIGFESVSQEAGECRFAPDMLGGIMALAIVCGTFIYLVLNTVTAGNVPAGYDSWVAYVQAAPSLEGLESFPTIHACHQMAGSLGLLLAGVTAICAVFSGVVGFYLAASRLVFAMAVDGAIAKSLAHAHDRHGTPVTATLVIMAVGFVVPFLGRTVLNWAVDLMSLGALIAYAYTSAAVLTNARRERNVVMTAMGAFGVALACVMGALLVVPLPGVGASLSRESYILLVAWVALGVNFFTPTVTRQPGKTSAPGR